MGEGVRAPACPECSKTGDRPERIYDLGSTTTLLGRSVFYDAFGKYHCHDPNKVTSTYRCSAGHTWSEVEPQPCPSCNWPEEVALAEGGGGG